MSHQPVKGRVDGANPYSVREPPLGLTTTITANLPVKEDNGQVKSSPEYGRREIPIEDLPLHPPKFDQDKLRKPAPLWDIGNEGKISFYLNQGYDINEVSNLTGISKGFIRQFIEESNVVSSMIEKDNYLRTLMSLKISHNADGVEISRPMSFHNLIDYLRNRGYNQENIIYIFTPYIGSKKAEDITLLYWPAEILA